MRHKTGQSVHCFNFFIEIPQCFGILQASYRVSFTIEICGKKACLASMSSRDRPWKLQESALGALRSDITAPPDTAMRLSPFRSQRASALVLLFLQRRVKKHLPQRGY